MTARGSTFKSAMHAGETQFGLFQCLPTAATVEALAGAGYGFFIFDVEHGPTSVPHVHAQLTALATSPTASIVRLSALDPVAIKHYLDIGADAIMVPNVESAAMARDAARFMRYPPAGVRGVGGSMRVTDYGRNFGYFTTANDEACLIVQIESLAGMRNVDEICSVPEVASVCCRSPEEKFWLRTTMPREKTFQRCPEFVVPGHL